MIGSGLKVPVESKMVGVEVLVRVSWKDERVVVST